MPAEKMGTLNESSVNASEKDASVAFRGAGAQIPAACICEKQSISNLGEA